MGFHEYIERKRITSVSIYPNGNVILKTNYSKNIILIGILTIIILLFAVIFVYYSYVEKKYEICTTKSCLESSVSLMNCMNETVNPCEDFYDFACGMFETNYPSYYDTDGNSWINILSLKLERKVKKFVTQKNEKYEPEAVHKTRKFYNACLSFTKDSNNNSYNTLRNIWDEVGLDTDYLSDSAPLEIETILAKIKIYFNIDVFFNIDVDSDPRNSSSHSLLIIYKDENPEKFKKRETMKSNKVTIEEAVPKFTEYFKLVVNKLLDHNQTRIRQLYAEDLLNTSEELEELASSISKISENSYRFNKDVPEIYTLGKLQNLTDSNSRNFQFNWTMYINKLLHDIEPGVYEQLTLENLNTYEILINNPYYVENIFKFLSETPTTLIKMYLLVQIVTKLETYFPHEKHLNSDYCFSTTTQLFGMVTGYSMINTLDNSTKAELTEMFINIKLALRTMIQESSWMDDETKKASLRKLDYTKTFLGYPNNYTNLLYNLYHNLNVTENHLENMISISMFNSKNNWKYLTKAVDWENMKWDVAPDEVNAYNYYSMNAFVIPAGILQSPWYYNGIPSLNYGAIGSLMGHELSHNFDNTGKQYNELGNVAPTWWTEKSQKEYEKRADCLVRYYDEIQVVNDKLRDNDTLEVDGNLTLNENIADIIGLKEAYYAYRIYVDAHGQELRLPGMEAYSPEQLLFLGYANQYCHYDTANTILDNHSPNRVRVQGVLSLLPEFSKTWACEIGTPMNPKTDEKCQIW